MMNLLTKQGQNPNPGPKKAAAALRSGVSANVLNSVKQMAARLERQGWKNSENLAPLASAKTSKTKLDEATGNHAAPQAQITMLEPRVMMDAVIDLGVGDLIGQIEAGTADDAEGEESLKQLLEFANSVQHMIEDVGDVLSDDIAATLGLSDDEIAALSNYLKYFSDGVGGDSPYLKDNGGGGDVFDLLFAPISQTAEAMHDSIVDFLHEDILDAVENLKTDAGLATSVEQSVEKGILQNIFDAYSIDDTELDDFKTDLLAEQSLGSKTVVQAVDALIEEADRLAAEDNNATAVEKFSWYDTLKADRGGQNIFGEFDAFLGEVKTAWAEYAKNLDADDFYNAPQSGTDFLKLAKELYDNRFSDEAKFSAYDVISLSGDLADDYYTGLYDELSADGEPDIAGNVARFNLIDIGLDLDSGEFVFGNNSADTAANDNSNIVDFVEFSNGKDIDENDDAKHVDVKVNLGDVIFPSIEKIFDALDINAADLPSLDIFNQDLSFDFDIKLSSDTGIADQFSSTISLENFGFTSFELGGALDLSSYDLSASIGLLNVTVNAINLATIRLDMSNVRLEGTVTVYTGDGEDKQNLSGASLALTDRDLSTHSFTLGTAGWEAKSGGTDISAALTNLVRLQVGNAQSTADINAGVEAEYIDVSAQMSFDIVKVEVRGEISGGDPEIPEPEEKKTVTQTLTEETITETISGIKVEQKVKIVDIPELQEAFSDSFEIKKGGGSWNYGTRYVGNVDFKVYNDKNVLVYETTKTVKKKGFNKFTWDGTANVEGVSEADMTGKYKLVTSNTKRPSWLSTGPAFTLSKSSTISVYSAVDVNSAQIKIMDGDGTSKVDGIKKKVAQEVRSLDNVSLKAGTNTINIGEMLHGIKLPKNNYFVIVDAKSTGSGSGNQTHTPGHAEFFIEPETASTEVSKTYIFDATPERPAGAIFYVYDEDNKLLHQEEVFGIVTKSYDFAWDGTLADGSKISAGKYTVKAYIYGNHLVDGESVEDGNSVAVKDKENFFPDAQSHTPREVKWDYSVSGGTLKSATLLIKDASDNIVFKHMLIDLDEGDHAFVWNGIAYDTTTDSEALPIGGVSYLDGDALAAGDYTFSIEDEIIIGADKQQNADGSVAVSSAATQVLASITKAKWSFDLVNPGSTDPVTLRIGVYDAVGQQVHFEDVSVTPSGATGKTPYTYEWDGSGANFAEMKDGKYRLGIIINPKADKFSPIVMLDHSFDIEKIEQITGEKVEIEYIERDPIVPPPVYGADMTFTLGVKGDEESVTYIDPDTKSEKTETLTTHDLTFDFVVDALYKKGEKYYYYEADGVRYQLFTDGEFEYDDDGKLISSPDYYYYEGVDLGVDIELAALLQTGEKVYVDDVEFEYGQYDADGNGVGEVTGIYREIDGEKVRLLEEKLWLLKVVETLVVFTGQELITSLENMFEDFSSVFESDFFDFEIPFVEGFEFSDLFDLADSLKTAITDKFWLDGAFLGIAAANNVAKNGLLDVEVDGINTENGRYFFDADAGTQKTAKANLLQAVSASAGNAVGFVITIDGADYDIRLSQPKDGWKNVDAFNEALREQLDLIEGQTGYTLNGIAKRGKLTLNIADPDNENAPIAYSVADLSGASALVDNGLIAKDKSTLSLDLAGEVPTGKLTGVPADIFNSEGADFLTNLFEFGLDISRDYSFTETGELQEASQEYYTMKFKPPEGEWTPENMLAAINAGFAEYELPLAAALVDTGDGMALEISAAFDVVEDFITLEDYLGLGESAELSSFSFSFELSNSFAGMASSINTLEAWVNDYVGDAISGASLSFNLLDTTPSIVFNLPELDFGFDTSFDVDIDAAIGGLASASFTTNIDLFAQFSAGLGIGIDLLEFADQAGAFISDLYADKQSDKKNIPIADNSGSDNKISIGDILADSIFFTGAEDSYEDAPWVNVNFGGSATGLGGHAELGPAKVTIAPDDGNFVEIGGNFTATLIGKQDGEFSDAIYINEFTSDNLKNLIGRFDLAGTIFSPDEEDETEYLVYAQLSGSSISADIAGLSLSVPENAIESITFSIEDAFDRDTWQVDVQSEYLELIHGFDGASLADTLYNSVTLVDTILTDLADQMSFLKQDIPLIDINVLDMMDFVKAFADEVKAFAEDPNGAISEVRQKLAEAFGLDEDELKMVWDNNTKTFYTSLEMKFFEGQELSYDFILDLKKLLGDSTDNEILQNLFELAGKMVNVDGSGSITIDTDLAFALSFGLDFQKVFNPNRVAVTTATNLEKLSSVSQLSLAGKGAAGKSELKLSHVIEKEDGTKDRKELLIDIGDETTIGGVLSKLYDVISADTLGDEVSIIVTGVNADDETVEITLDDSNSKLENFGVDGLVISNIAIIDAGGEPDITGLEALFGSSQALTGSTNDDGRSVITANAVLENLDFTAAPFSFDIQFGDGEPVTLEIKAYTVQEKQEDGSYLEVTKQITDADSFVEAARHAIDKTEISRAKAGIGLPINIALSQLIDIAIADDGKLEISTTNFFETAGYEEPELTIDGVAQPGHEINLSDLDGSNVARALGFVDSGFADEVKSEALEGDASESGAEVFILTDDLTVALDSGSVDLKGTGIKFSFDANVDDFSFNLNLGPFQASIVEGSINLYGGDLSEPAFIAFGLDDMFDDIDDGRVNVSAIIDVFKSSSTKSISDLFTLDAQIAIEVDLPIKDSLGLLDAEIHGLNFTGDLLAISADAISAANKFGAQGAFASLAGLTSEKVFDLLNFDIDLPDIEDLLSQINPFALINDPRVLAGGLKEIFSMLDKYVLDGLEEMELPLIGDGITQTVSIFDDIENSILEPILEEANIPNEDGTMPTSVDLLLRVVNRELNELFGTTDAQYVAAHFHTNLNTPVLMGAIQFNRTIYNDILDVELDFGVPGLELDMSDASDVYVDVGFDGSIGFGIDKDGFFFLNDTNMNEIDLSAEVYVDPGFGASVSMLSLLKLTASAKPIENSDKHGVWMTGNIGIDLFGQAGTKIAEAGYEGDISALESLGKGGERDGFENIVRLDEVSFKKAQSGIGIEAFSLQGQFEAHANLHLKSEIINPTDGSSIEQIPSAMADFVFDATYTIGGGLNIEQLDLINVGIDVGSFFKGTILPIYKQIDDYIGPVTDFLADLKTEIVAGITIADIIAIGLDIASPGLGSKFKTLVNVAASIDKIGDVIDDTINNGGIVNFGSFSLLTTGSDGEKIASMDSAVIFGNKSASGNPGKSQSITDQLSGDGPGLHFSLDLINDPMNAINLLLGNLSEVDLVSVELVLIEEEVHIDFKEIIRSALSSVIPSRILDVVLSPFDGKFDFELYGGLTAGYDLSGVAKFLDSGDIEDILSGMYFASGAQNPLLHFHFGISGGVDIPIGIGDVYLKAFGSTTFDLYVNDPNDDGKLRFAEIGYAIDTGQILKLVEGSYNLNGGISFGADLGFSVFGGWVTILDVNKTLGFKISGTFLGGDFAPEYISSEGDIAYINIGNRAQDLIGKQVEDGDDKVSVVGRQIYINGQSAGAFNGSTLVVDMGEGDDVVDLSQIDPSVSLRVNTGKGNDEVILGANAKGTVLTGEGDDVIKIASGNSVASSQPQLLVHAGDGEDNIDLSAMSAGAIVMAAGEIEVEHNGEMIALSEWILRTSATTAQAQEKIKQILPRFTTDMQLKGDGNGDMIKGTQGSDLILAGRGDDVIDGGSGDDIIMAGAGDDAIHGGVGNDTINAGAGDDYVLGEAGNDIIFGWNGTSSEIGTNSELAYGWANSDSAAPEAEQLNGALKADGKDWLDGGEGDDFIFGQADDDIIIGGLGDDSGVYKGMALGLSGGQGNDTIIGGNATLLDNNGRQITAADPGFDLDKGFGLQSAVIADGNDALFGGAGNDIVVGGGGDDTIDGASGDNIAIGDFADLTFAARFVAKQIDAVGIEAEFQGDDQITTGGNADIIVGGGGSDVIDAGHGVNYVVGDSAYLAGTDLAVAVEELTSYYSSKDDGDTITTGLTSSVIIAGGGGEAVDSVTTGETYGAESDSSQRMVIFGDYGDLRAIGQKITTLTTVFDVGDDDKITTTNGNDIMLGGAGNDTLTSTGGNNIVFADSGTYQAVAEDEANGLGAGLVISTAHNATDNQTTATTKTEQSITGDDVIDVSGANQNIVLGGGGSDTVKGGSGLDTILGDLGSVGIYQHKTDRDDDGVSERRSKLIATAENRLGSDISGVDTIYAGTGDDFVIGGDGADKIYGGKDADTLDPDASLLAVGDLGSASFVGDRPSLFLSQSVNQAQSQELSDDLIAQYKDLSDDQVEDFNTLDLTQSQAAYQSMQILDEVALQSVDSTYGGDDAIIGGDKQDYIIGGAGNDTLDLGQGDNWALGDSGAIDLTAGTLSSVDEAEGGTDTITGGNDRDYIIGGQGADTINTGDGQNMVIGDGGQMAFDPDTLYAKIIETEQVGIGGDDVITGGKDHDYVVAGAGDDKVLSGAGDDIVFGDAGQIDRTKGVLTSIQTSIGGKDHIETGAGDDVAIGGQDDDFIVGGDGDDTIIGDSAEILSNLVDASQPSEAKTEVKKITSLGTDDGGDDRLDGGAGSDTMIGGAGSDLLSAGAGNDLAVGDWANVDFESGTTQSVSMQVNGDDVIDAGADRDIVIGGGGKDSLAGGQGSDLVTGDYADIGFANDFVVQELVLTGPEYGDSDEIWSGSSDALTDRFTNAGMAAPTGSPDNGNNIVVGQAGSDVITGDNGSDLVVGDWGEFEIASHSLGYGDTAFELLDSFTSTLHSEIAGDDIVNAGGGDDIAIGGDGRDKIDGGEGDDYVIGDGGKYETDHNGGEVLQTQFPYAGSNDVLVGGDGNDILIGGAREESGGDLLFGNTKEDFLIGEDGHLTIENGKVIKIDLPGNQDLISNSTNDGATGSMMKVLESEIHYEDLGSGFASIVSSSAEQRAFSGYEIEHFAADQHGPAFSSVHETEFESRLRVLLTNIAVFLDSDLRIENLGQDILETRGEDKIGDLWPRTVHELSKIRSDTLKDLLEISAGVLKDTKIKLLIGEWRQNRLAGEDVIVEIEALVRKQLFAKSGELDKAEIAKTSKALAAYFRIIGLVFDASDARHEGLSTLYADASSQREQFGANNQSEKTHQTNP